ncbi:uncharacterized protein A1O5_01973 [Cladophialophora psammophila CBS 110553]|uniref:Heterokaryon incompatibility domain-containing protein n=1 Tax=Cladophialophora psammophila CBS 110553 TaxID=1182543 RepID=W9X465_9EURO|nr:uncharacterized protein A1O5_01973 [Cladophialophora psammophila CBS 110553]EXJ75277.1 hypothetical protein A1O5_01973 [Cladophialophora psammophila CBS 110553]
MIRGPVQETDTAAYLAESRRPPGSKKTRHLLPGETSSEATFKTIQAWMTDCLGNHPNCPKSHVGNGSHTPPLPRRLLEVANGKVVLREVAGQKRHPYACLSHCWGPSPRRPESTILKAKRATIEKLKVEVPWKELSKTFQDAIDICRRLGIDFLWIDALCILQDSNADWSLNAAEVGSIYENALITIAASKSKEGCQGCYSTADPRYLARLVGGSDNVYVRLKPPSYPVHEVYLDLENFPLLDRAWVYQEMHLSARVLHFCSQEVIWSCRRMRRSESGVSDEEATDELVNLTDLHGWDPSWKTLGENGKEDPRTLWYRTVEEYTRLHISYPSDIFPALAALTQRLHRLKPQDMFLAGLWKNTLLLDLMWRAPAGPQFGRPAKWRAPSWSWASVQVRVAWDLRLDSVFGVVELLDVRCDTKGPPEMGSFSGRDEVVITLRAPLLKATWKKPWVRSRWPIISRSTEMKDGKMDVNRFYPDYDYDLPGEHHVSWDSEFVLVPIAISTMLLDESDSDGPKNNAHLVLALRAKRKAGTYERLGYGEIVEDHVFADWSREGFQARFGRVDAILRAIPRQVITVV